MPEPTLVTLQQFTQLQRPHLDFVIDPFIPKTGLVVLGGAPFAGKSFLALQLAFAVAQGGSMFGARCTQGPVLYLQFDVGELVFRRVIESISAKGDDTSGPVFTLHPGTELTVRDLSDHTFNAQLASAIRQCDPVLVVFDVLREIHNRRENSSDAMKLLFEQIERLTEGRGCLLLHHVKKPDKDTATGSLADRLRGSSYIAGRVDTLWIIENSELMMESRLHAPLTIPGERRASGFWEFKDFPRQAPLSAAHSG
jgi:RecA-family ATPase